MSEYTDPNNGMTFGDLLRAPNFKQDEASNELAFLFREMLKQNRLSISQWEVMTERFYTAVHGNNRKAIAQAKINLSRGLVKDALTWGRFMEVLYVLGFDKYEISITMRNEAQGDVGPVERKYVCKVKNRYKRRGRGNPLPLPEEPTE